MIFENTFIFDIETVPDLEGARKLYDLASLDDNAVAEYLFSKRRQEANTDFMRHHLHQVVAISIVLKQANNLSVWSLGNETSDEADLIQRFFKGIERYEPTLISWNGGGFDLPVLHYRALRHGIQASTYWEMGHQNNQFKWNNYISRFHFRHTDLMDVLSGYQMRCVAPLDEIATLLGFPGKMGMDGSKVWQTYAKGDIKSIRDYCETDVLNTYLVYLQFELMRGHLTQTELQKAQDELKDYLATSEQTHFQDFLRSWDHD